MKNKSKVSTFMLAILFIVPCMFMLVANDDGTIRTYSGCRMIFNRFIRRNHLEDLNIHFHGLRHTFSNMLFELNENPKVIQQLLGHKDVKTTYLKMCVLMCESVCQK